MRKLLLLVAISTAALFALCLLFIADNGGESSQSLKVHRWNPPTWRESWTLLNGDDIFKCNDRCKKSRASLCEAKGDFLWPLFTCCKDECPKSGARCPANRSLLVEC